MRERMPRTVRHTLCVRERMPRTAAVEASPPRPFLYIIALPHGFMPRPSVFSRCVPEFPYGFMPFRVVSGFLN